MRARASRLQRPTQNNSIILRIFLSRSLSVCAWNETVVTCNNRNEWRAVVSRCVCKHTNSIGHDCFVIATFLVQPSNWTIQNWTHDDSALTRPLVFVYDEMLMLCTALFGCANEFRIEYSEIAVSRIGHKDSSRFLSLSLPPLLSSSSSSSERHLRTQMSLLRVCSLTSVSVLFSFQLC